MQSIQKKIHIFTELSIYPVKYKFNYSSGVHVYTKFSPGIYDEFIYADFFFFFLCLRVARLSGSN